MRRWFFVAFLTALLLAAPVWSAPTPRGIPSTAPAEPPKLSQSDRADKIQEAREKARQIAAINRQISQLFNQGEYAECEPLLEDILEINPSDGAAWYNLACVHSRMARKDRAVECLNTAVSCGYTDFQHIQRDADLDAIRRTEGYKKLIARKDEVHRQRAEKIHSQLRQ